MLDLDLNFYKPASTQTMAQPMNERTVNRPQGGEDEGFCMEAIFGISVNNCMMKKDMSRRQQHVIVITHIHPAL